MGTHEAEGAASQGLENLWNEVAETTLSMSDEDVLLAATEAGDNVAGTAASVRLLLLGEVKAFRQERLKEALVEYQQNAQRFRERGTQLPTDPAERRQLLTSLLTRLPTTGQAFLTVQHRDFKSLSDADIESLLKQLEALGVSSKE